MIAADPHKADRPGAEQGVVVVGDIAAHLHTHPAIEVSHRYDRAVVAAVMAEVLTRHLDLDLRIEVDGTVWCRIPALTENGSTSDETTGASPRRAAATWEESVVENVDLAAIERVDPADGSRWEATYGVGAAAAIRTAAASAAGGGAGRAGQVGAVRALVTWPIERSAWVATTPLTAA